MASDSPRVLALRTRSQFGGVLGCLDEHRRGESGGDTLSDGSCVAFHVGETLAATAGHGVGASQLRENFVGDAIEFGFGGLGEGHG